MSKRFSIGLLAITLISTSLLTGCWQKKDLTPQTNEPVEIIKETTEEKLTAIESLFQEKYGEEILGVTVAISKEADNHVRGLVQVIAAKGPQSGGIYLATKIDDQWQIVHDGQETIDCQKMNDLDFPENMISDCVETEVIE